METYTLADARKAEPHQKWSERGGENARCIPVKVYPDTLEASEVKQEVTFLLSELKPWGLLPVNVPVSPDPM